MEKTSLNLLNCIVEFYKKKSTVIYLLFFVISISALLGCSRNEEVLQSDNALYSKNFQKKTMTLESQLDLLNQKTRSFYTLQSAIGQGWDTDATGYMTQMGHHFVNDATFGDDFDMLNPEALLYVPNENGIMQFVGVEYLVFEDPSNIRPAPEGFIGAEDVWSYSQLYQAWTLHVWIRLENPNGIFAPLNPILD